MKHYKKYIALSILVLMLMVLYALPAWASITARNYGMSEGRQIRWNGRNYFVNNPWDVYFEDFSNYQGTALNFSDTQFFVNNGYLVVGRDQWVDWVSSFGGNFNSVVSHIEYDTVQTPLGPVDFAWLSQIANVCGWRVKDWDNAGWAIYERIPAEEPPPAPANLPPTARFSWPSTVFVGDTVKVTDQSFDSDGEVVDWDWSLSSYSGVSAFDLNKTGGTIVFGNVGTYTLRLTVTDDDGDLDSTSKSISVLQPKPTAEISVTGSLKENRKVVLDSEGSTSPSLYPIDHSLDEWVITPLSGGDEQDIKTLPRSGTTKQVLFKQPGMYKVGLRVHNSLHSSDWTYENIVIIPDEPPVANFTVPSIVFRNPSDSSWAAINLTDNSLSLDGDIVSQRIWKYKFDSDNDGSFLGETWIDLDTDNNVRPALRVDHVGKYLFSLEIKEAFGQETISQFINDADYRRGDTSAKPQNDKVAEVKNIAPVTSFSARTQSKAALVFVKGNADPAKTSSLETQINQLVLPKFRSKKIDADIRVVDVQNFGPNLTGDPSFEHKSGWNNGVASLHGDAQWDTSASAAHSGTGSLLIIGEEERWSYGKASNISGWAAGDYLEISGWIKVSDYTKGTVNVDLYGYVTSGSIWDPVGVTCNYETPGYVFFRAVEGPIPSKVRPDKLYLRVFADGYPDLKVNIDDVAVRKVLPNKSMEEILAGLTWTADKNRFLINISDAPDILDADSFARSLAAAGINYSVLGTDSNKAAAENLIALNSANGAFYYNSNMAAALNSLGTYLSSAVPIQSGESVSYILLDESIECTPSYSDYENDPKLLDSWSYEHDPGYVDNNSAGESYYHRKILAEPLTRFDKYGKYNITYKAMDDPTKGNSLFNNYRLFSDPAPTSIIVHRRPVADFSAAPGTLSITDLSYDPDFQYRRPDKGIIEWLWKWRKRSSAVWTTGKPDSITELGEYVIHLEVKDIYGVWSLPVEKTITVASLQKPPVADFIWLPSDVYEGDTITLHNMSSDPDGEPLTYLWTVFNPLGITTTYTSKDVILDRAVPGTYWVTLRVWDPGGLTDVSTRSFVVKELAVTGHVKHTVEWNENRIRYNREISGTDELPRPYNTFWAGETFVLEADTTDTLDSQTKANSVQAALLSHGITAELSPKGTGNTLWTGAMWRDDFEQLPDGVYLFRFTITYSNGVVKNNDVEVTVRGSWQDYFNYHRGW